MRLKQPHSSTMAMPKTGKTNPKYKVSGEKGLRLFRLLPSLCGFAFTGLLSTSGYALEKRLDNHLFEVGFRPQMGYVEADNHAKAASLLMRFRATSTWNDAVSTLLELDHVELAWEDEFSNGVHFNGNPVIPNAGGTDLNQLLIKAKLSNHISLSIGREVINLGNQRFVGGNGFWQNEQSFDALGIDYDIGTASQISYRYIINANRITGDDAGKNLYPGDINFEPNNGVRPARFLGDHEHETHSFFARVREWDHAQIQAYYFNVDNKDVPTVSNDTLGVRYEYKGRLNKFRSLAHAEIALQDRKNLDHNGALHYINVGLGAGYRANELSLNYEYLDARNEVSFTTPLASLHDHNGWADKFLAVPGTGLEDISIKYIWRKHSFKVDTRYHFFHATDSGVRYGEELDLDLVYRINPKNSVLLRYADFNGKSNTFTDEQRLFLMYTHHL